MFKVGLLTLNMFTDYSQTNPADAMKDIAKRMLDGEKFEHGVIPIAPPEKPAALTAAVSQPKPATSWLRLIVEPNAEVGSSAQNGNIHCLGETEVVKETILHRCGPLVLTMVEQQYLQSPALARKKGAFEGTLPVGKDGGLLEEHRMSLEIAAS